MLVTYFHEYRIYESTIFFHEIFLGFFKNNFYFVAPLKDSKTFFVKKIREFIDSEFVKTCHEYVSKKGVRSSY